MYVMVSELQYQYKCLNLFALGACRAREVQPKRCEHILRFSFYPFIVLGGKCISLCYFKCFNYVCNI